MNTQQTGRRSAFLPAVAWMAGISLLIVSLFGCLHISGMGYLSNWFLSTPQPLHHRSECTECLGHHLGQPSPGAGWCARSTASARWRSPPTGPAHHPDPRHHHQRLPGVQRLLPVYRLLLHLPGSEQQYRHLQPPAVFTGIPGWQRHPHRAKKWYLPGDDPPTISPPCGTGADALRPGPEGRPCGGTGGRSCQPVAAQHLCAGQRRLWAQYPGCLPVVLCAIGSHRSWAVDPGVHRVSQRPVGVSST